MTFSVDVYGHSNSDFFWTQSNAPNTETYSVRQIKRTLYQHVFTIFTFQMSKWRHHYRKKCNFVHIATSSFLVEQFCDTESCMANQKDGHGDLHCMCHLLVHVSL